MATHNLERRCRAEIIELHEFFAAWYNGEIENMENVFARFSSVLFSHFHMVHPDGGVFDRGQVMEMVRNGWGNYRKGESPENGRFEVEIRNVEMKASVDDGNVVLVSYEEWQRVRSADVSTGHTDWRGRASTVLFYADDNCNNGLTWASVHERWMAG